MTSVARQKRRQTGGISAVAVLFFIGILLAGSSSLNDVDDGSSTLPPDSCTDGIDNDNDGFTDSADNECTDMTDGDENGDQPPPV